MNFISTRVTALPQELHPRGCGIPEVDKFQTVVDNYQIIVLSAKQSNGIVYEEPRREQQIHPYHCENHFDIITSVSRILWRSY